MRSATFFSLLLLISFLNIFIAQPNVKYQNTVDKTVDQFLAGENLDESGIDVISKIIASRNSVYASKIFFAYRNAQQYLTEKDRVFFREGNLKSSNINFENIIEQYELADKLVKSFYKPNSPAKKINKITTSVYNEVTDGGGDAANYFYEDPPVLGEVEKLSGYFHSIYDVDYYKINVVDPNNFSVYLDLESYHSTWEFLILLDEDGNLIFERWINTSNPYNYLGLPGFSAGDVLVPTEPGTYYLGVYAEIWGPFDEFCNEAWGAEILTHSERLWGGHPTNQPVMKNGVDCFVDLIDEPMDPFPYTLHITGIGTDVVLPPPTIGQWTIREDTYFRKTFPAGPDYSASSNTYYVQPRFNGSVLYVTPVSNWNGTAKITVNASGTTQDYYLRVLPVNDRPVIFPIANQTMEANQIGTVGLGGRDVDNQFLTFTARSSQSGLSTSISGRTLTLTPEPDWSGTAQVTVLVSDGFLTDAWIFDVSVNPPASSVYRRVAGYMYYGDTDESIEESSLELRNEEGTTVYSSPISEKGEFEFESVANGYYELAIAKENDPDVLTAADALLTLKQAINSQKSVFTYILDAAADVDANDAVTAADALNILYRVIGTTNSFVKPDWITVMPQIGVGATDLQLPLWAMKTGDLDKSFLNSNVGKRNVMYKSGETIQVTKGEEIVVPVQVSSLSDFAAFDMTIKYDSENLEFLGVKSGLGIMSNVVDNEIKLAWLNTNLENSINIEEGSSLLELRFNAKGELSKGYRADFVPTKGEFLSKNGNKQSPVITISGISESTPMNFDLAQNYPNPFNPSTQITYSLPITGQVELTIFNVVGQKVATLVNEAKEAGNHKVEWNAENIPSGVYFYTLNVNGSQSYRTTKKMLLLK